MKRKLIASHYYTMDALETLIELNEKTKPVRRIWVRDWYKSRSTFCMYNHLLRDLNREDPKLLKNYLRMPKKVFKELFKRLKKRLKKRHVVRKPLSVGLKLVLTLRYLASGASYSSMRFHWRLPHNTISCVVREVCTALVEELTDEMMKFPTNEEEWEKIAKDFYEIWDFPHVLGAIDGKHVAMKAPLNSGTLYHNYKGFFSILLLGVVDADYKFIYADVGGKGSSSDAQMFNASELKEGLEHDLLSVPKPVPLPGDNQPVPYFLVGDDIFSLRTYLMKPYSKRGMTIEERIFNYRLSRARRVVENAFGILCSRFRVLLHTMEQDPATVRLILKACILLHNLLRTRCPTFQKRKTDHVDETVEPGCWRRGIDMLDTVREKGANTATIEGKKMRNLIRHWVNDPVGEVPWQNQAI